MWFCWLVIIFLGNQPVFSCGSYNCSFWRAGELEMRLRMMEVEGIMDFGELEEQTGNKNRMKGNWKKMEEYGGEEGETQVQRQRRGIFMRDNVALARCFF